MSTIRSIRERRREGATVAGIARAEGVSEPTVRKYLAADDLSPEPPGPRRSRASKLDPYKPQVNAWLEEDRRRWRKQRHTAKRIFDRLREECGYDGGYTTVQKYVREAREAASGPRGQFLDLEWAPGEAQADFGEADFRYRGVVTRMFYLVVSFPFSNVALAQLSFGETAECVCEGLGAVFGFIGGVPSRVVFDNATGVGRRVGETVRTSRLFDAFAAHYGLAFDFCNPASGHEKGSVESAVGAIRRNLFVPMPHFDDVRGYNARLLARCLERADAPHYLKGESCRRLFVEDEAALAELPGAPFRAVTRVDAKTDKYGRVCLGGRHWYSTSPAYPLRRMAVELGAFDVAVYDGGGALVATHERAWGDAVTDTRDPVSQLALLCRKPGGWRNSQVRATLPEDLRAYADGLDREGLKGALRTMRNVCAGAGYAAAAEAMAESVRRTGALDEATVALLASGMARGLGAVEYGGAVDMSAYDAAIEGRPS